jgi:hypothetical protein
MKKMKKILTAFFLLISLGAFSQDILLHQNVKADTIRPTYGPNLRHYVHGYVGIGFPLPTSEESDYIKKGLSTNLELGIRYKRKFTNYLSTGLDLGINSTSYKLKQYESKTVPDESSNDKEKIQVNSIMGSGWIRINVGRRGNYIGNYMDLGAYGSWNFMKKHKTTNQNEAGEKVKVSTSQLNYVENFSYGMMARIGAGRYAFTANYRISDIFEPAYSLSELPRLIVGIELGLFR